jgi:hypothetical protein
MAIKLELRPQISCTFGIKTKNIAEIVENVEFQYCLFSYFVI